jgi:hypothetical protein
LKQGGFQTAVAAETLLSETDMASLLNMAPVCIDPRRKRSLAKQVWLGGALTLLCTGAPQLQVKQCFTGEI